MPPETCKKFVGSPRGSPNHKPGPKACKSSTGRGRAVLTPMSRKLSQTFSGTRFLLSSISANLMDAKWDLIVVLIRISLTSNASIYKPHVFPLL